VNPYEILGIDSDASEADIKKAYRSKSSEAHPDQGGDPERMQLVNLANDLLSNAERRARYDQTGETVERPPLDLEAQGALMQLFNELIEKTPEHAELVSAARQATQQHLQQLDIEASALGKQHKSLTKRLTKVVKKGGAGLNAFEAVVNDKISKVMNTLERNERRRAVAKRVMGMLDEYQDAESVQFINCTFDGSTTSTRFFG
jgi:curved DNA-binding protein CbpA